MKLSSVVCYCRVELLKGEVKLTETVNFCETIEESEGEEGKDSSQNSSFDESVPKKIKGKTLFERNTNSNLKSNIKKEGRNGVDMKRFHTVY